MSIKGTAVSTLKLQQRFVSDKDLRVRNHRPAAKIVSDVTNLVKENTRQRLGMFSSFRDRLTLL